MSHSDKEFSSRAQNLSASSIETLNHLFSAVPPDELRENLLEIYHTYLMLRHESLSVNFDSISKNLYHLLHCLPDVKME
jgi:hypothetical protein